MIEAYQKELDGRYETMRLAFQLFERRLGSIIVETGCVRQAGDWGGGMSTLLFGEHLWTVGGHLWTVDNDRAHLDIAREITAPYASQITYCEADSVSFLKNWAGPKIDLLYLDSFDYPFGELLDLYGGRNDIQEALKTVWGLGDEEVVRRHGDMIAPCQQHCRSELLAALPSLHADAVVLIDDANIPGGGKARLAREVLVSNGWMLLGDGQQCLWVRRPERSEGIPIA